MPKSRTEQAVKLLWIVGIVIWCATVALLMHSHYEAQTFAQASLASMRLEFVALVGTFWALAGAFWLARLGKVRTS